MTPPLRHSRTSGPASQLDGVAFVELFPGPRARACSVRAGDGLLRRDSIRNSTKYPCTDLRYKPRSETDRQTAEMGVQRVPRCAQTGRRAGGHGGPRARVVAVVDARWVANRARVEALAGSGAAQGGWGNVARAPTIRLGAWDGGQRSGGWGQCRREWSGAGAGACCACDGCGAAVSAGTGGWALGTGA